ncbi:MAG: hypothetical protein LUD68_01885 [Rikenellaceae bacterium]|nr:hypothetical protein [Rikenellaceae bacterium]
MTRFFRIAMTVLGSCIVFSCQEPKPASAYDVWGIDVSRHQQHIDWKTVCQSDKPHFVFLKATEGTLIQDPLYRKHRQELECHGILWGAYHFFGHRTSGKEQARHFIRTAALEKGNLIPVLDVEPHKFFEDPEKMVREVKAFCTEIKREYGVWPIIYSSSHFYRSYLQREFPEKSFHIWIADYSGIPQIDWQFWQHTDSHRLTGVTSAVDRNVFSGKASELQNFILR